MPRSVVLAATCVFASASFSLCVCQRSRAFNKPCGHHNCRIVVVSVRLFSYCKIVLSVTSFTLFIMFIILVHVFVSLCYLSVFGLNTSRQCERPFIIYQQEINYNLQTAAIITCHFCCLGKGVNDESLWQVLPFCTQYTILSRLG